MTYLKPVQLNRQIPLGLALSLSLHVGHCRRGRHLAVTLTTKNVFKKDQLYHCTSCLEIQKKIEIEIFFINCPSRINFLESQTSLFIHLKKTYLKENMHLRPFFLAMNIIYTGILTILNEPKSKIY